MKIAQIAPINCVVSFEGSASGVCDIIGDITNSLVKRKHQVDLFSVSSSTSNARICYAIKDAISPSKISKQDIISGNTFSVLSAINTSQVYYKSANYDIIHSHLGNNGQVESIFFAPLVDTPTISTIHCPLEEISTELLKLNHKNHTFIGISKSQLRNYNFLHAKVVYHGIDTQKFAFSQNADNYFLFVGRLHEQKGAHTIVEIARKEKISLKIIGKVPSDHKNYFNDKIKKYLNEKIKLIGELPRVKVINYFQKAKALVVPLGWEEPFGLTLVESMATGTPVIAFARGSVPEIIKDGKTGFIVNYSDKDKRGNWIIKKTGIAGLTEAVKKIYSMPEDVYRKMRLACRKHVEENFTVEKMVDNYEKVYKEVITDWNKKHKK